MLYVYVVVVSAVCACGGSQCWMCMWWHSDSLECSLTSVCMWCGVTCTVG